MSAPAPERESPRTDATPDASLEPASVPASFEQRVEGMGLTRWWATMTDGRRQQLLTLTSEEPLPRTVAAELPRYGVQCPLALVTDGTRRIRRALPPPALVQFLDGRRREEFNPDR